MLSVDQPSESHAIGLNATLAEQLFPQALNDAIQAIVRSVRFEVMPDNRALRLLGPDTPYHAIDPFLPDVLRRFDGGLSVADIPSFRARREHFDLCFEDSWSGCFAAHHFAAGEQDVVILHLDDHTDMMPTLLACQDDGTLVNAATRMPFDLTSQNDWCAAIAAGAVGIGNFVTPLFFGARRTHVRHLNNAADASLRRCAVVKEVCRYDLIPDMGFAGVQFRELSAADGVGTYVSASKADDLLVDLPGGDVIVHVDLDYFVNDFNGNPRDAGPYAPSQRLIDDGRRKLCEFFDSLRLRRVPVAHWIVATSPGFCCACHWSWLLSELAEQIAGYHAGAQSGRSLKRPVCARDTAFRNTYW